MVEKTLFKNKPLLSNVDYEHFDFHDIIENGPYYTPGCSFDLKIDYNVYTQDYDISIKNVKCYYKTGFKELYKPELKLVLYTLDYKVDEETKFISLPISTNTTQESNIGDEIKWHLSHDYADTGRFNLAVSAYVKYKNGYEE